MVLESLTGEAPNSACTRCQNYLLSGQQASLIDTILNLWFLAKLSIVSTFILLQTTFKGSFERWCHDGTTMLLLTNRLHHCRCQSHPEDLHLESHHCYCLACPSLSSWHHLQPHMHTPPLSVQLVPRECNDRVQKSGQMGIMSQETRLGIREAMTADPRRR